jgi:hypothetical protein
MPSESEEQKWKLQQIIKPYPCTKPNTKSKADTLRTSAKSCQAKHVHENLTQEIVEYQLEKAVGTFSAMIGL